MQKFLQKITKIGYVGLALMLVLPMIALWPALKASALTGAGTSVSPYQIFTCSDWMDIWDDLDAYYLLMNDISCGANGGDIVIGDAVLAFSGNLNGGNNTITVAIDDAADPDDAAGLFYYLGGTVKNLEIAGEVESNASAGGLATFAEYSTVENVDVTANVQGGNKTGGMIGEISSSVTISDSTVTGDVVGANETGGFVGAATGTSVTDSTYSGSITGAMNVGGMYGNANSSPLTRVGVSADIQADDTVGGLAGSYSGNTHISESYAIGSVTAADASAGGLLGFINTNGVVENSYSQSDVSADFRAAGIAASALTNASFTNVYASGLITSGGSGGLVATTTSSFCVDSFWDSRDGANPNYTDCSNNGATSRQTTEKMKDYFLYTAQPSRNESWDFDAVWGINPVENDGYPFLQWQGYESDYERDQDPVDGEIEDAGPNGGDADDSGAPDADESDAASLPGAHDATKYISVRSNTENCNFESIAAVEEDTLEDSDTDYEYPNGLVDFSLECDVAGRALDMKVFFHGFDSDSLPVVRKYSPLTGEYGTIDNAPTTVIMDGKSVYMVAYLLEDGGPFDSDGVNDGSISDPIGIAVPASTEGEDGPDSPGDTPASLAGTGSNTIPVMSAALVIIISSTIVLRLSRPTKSTIL